jgi:hypothetical protein
MIALAAIALALFVPVIFLGATQPNIAPHRRAALAPYGTDDPRDWQAALDDPTEPKLTVVRS